MKTKNLQTFLAAWLTLAVLFAVRPGALAQFPPRGDDTTPSMGQFSILVFTNFQAMMAGYPGYNAATHTLVSPVLYDNNTLIGRSNPLHEGDATDVTGVLVGTAGTNVSDAMLLVQPGGLGPVGTREVHTMIYSLNMTPGGAPFGPPAVRAGTNAPTQPNSVGEVQSWSGALGLPANDFPAQSFFDVFVEVDLAGGGTSFPGATNLHNDVPLLIQNTNLLKFPPEVVYIHGMSTAVPIKFRGDNPGVWTNGQIFGLLTLAGHGTFRTNDSANTATFLNTLSTVTPAPVEPQYSNQVGAPVVIAGTNMMFPGKGDDLTTSLGTFTIAVNPAFQPLLAGYPFYNPATKRLTSPLLFDQASKIGRSGSVLEGSAADLNGVPVGSANTLVKDSSIVFIPPVFESPPNTVEVHTEVRTLNMTGGGAAVRAGTAAPGVPGSYGEVESLAGGSGNPFWAFPAKSFFDIFTAVDLPPGGGLPAFTVTNTKPLVVQNKNLTGFPPKVIYVHGNSTAVPVAFTADIPAIGVHAGDIFGILLLAGHGINFNPQDPNDVAAFQEAIAQMTEAPVDPQFAGWAPGLNVPLQIGNWTIQSGPSGVAVQINGYCTANTHLLLQATPFLTNPNWATITETQGTSNGTFNVFATAPPNAGAMFYRMVDTTR